MYFDPNPTSESRTDPGRLRWAVTLLLIVMFLVLTGLRTSNLLLRKDELLAEGHGRTQAYAHILGTHFDQTVAAVDTALVQMAIHSRQVGGPIAPALSWDAVLEAALSGLPNIASLSVIDEKGLVVHSTTDDILGHSQGTQFSFDAAQANPNGGIIIDAPLQSRLDGRPLIPLARPLVSPSGDFQGMVIATLDPELLREIYRSVDLGADGIIKIIHPAGPILIREPMVKDTEVTQLDRELLAGSEVGLLRGVTRRPIEADGASFLTAFEILPRSGIMLRISLSEDELLQAWWHDVAVSFVTLGIVGALLAIAGLLINREISARMSAAEALRLARARFYEILYHAPLLASVKDSQGRIQFINRAVEERLDVTLDAVLGKRFEDFTTDSAAAHISAMDAEVLQSKQSLQREISYIGRHGTRAALFVKFPLFDQKGEVEAIASLAMDLTEQRRAQTWFKVIMDNAPAAVVLKDLQGRYIFANRQLEQWVGVKASELIGKTTRDLFPEDYADMHDEFDAEVIRTGASLQREHTTVTSGRPQSVLFLKFPIFGPDGEVDGIGSIGTDITDQKHAVAQLAQAQRMEALGQLTGGIAHDFNNLLTIILGNAEILTELTRDNEKLRPLAQVTLDAAERSAALTQRLLAFGRRQMLAPRPTDVNDLIYDMRDLIQRAIGEQISMEFQQEPKLWSANIDPTQLETAILNLIVNSRDAMPTGGRIFVETANVEMDETYAQLNPDAKPGNYVMIAVSDTGTGMPPEVVARVFEPFFTTKEVGKGTGLGLPTIYGFVKQSGGHIKVYSEVGHGTVVRLYFPRIEAPSIVPQPEPGGESGGEPGTDGGRETILLVEDDRLVRVHAESQLRGLGYHVIVAGNAAQALELAKSNGKPDLLLTDVVMPGGMNGRELADEIRKRWPDLRVLYMSGYTGDAMDAPLGAAVAELHFLSKPFRRRDLAAKVREALDAPAAAPAG